MDVYRYINTGCYLIISSIKSYVLPPSMSIKRNKYQVLIIVVSDFKTTFTCSSRKYLNYIFMLKEKWIKKTLKSSFPKFKTNWLEKNLRPDKNVWRRWYFWKNNNFQPWGIAVHSSKKNKPMFFCSLLPYMVWLFCDDSNGTNSFH